MTEALRRSARLERIKGEIEAEIQFMTSVSTTCSTGRMGRIEVGWSNWASRSTFSFGSARP
eukprot:7269144-Heterocapsa_arctica.AAC.1